MYWGYGRTLVLNLLEMKIIVLMFYLARGIKIKRVMGEGSEVEGRGSGGWWRSGCCVLIMKLISWNVRGLGGFEKWREVKQLMREKCPFILCIQETKLVIFDDIVCKSISGDANVDCSFQPSEGASRGWSLYGIVLRLKFGRLRLLRMCC